MRKSNWLILALLVVASAGLLWLWYFLRFDAVDHPRDLVLSVVWWLVVLVAVIGIHQAEKLRRRRLRTAFVAPGCIFNPEAGIVRVEREGSLVAALQQMVDGLSYGFSIEDMPRRTQLRYTHIVHTDRFSDQGDTWEGDVVELGQPSASPRSFASRDELERLIGTAA